MSPLGQPQKERPVAQLLTAAVVVAVVPVVSPMIVIFDLPGVVMDIGMRTLAVFGSTIVPAHNLKFAADVAGVAGRGRWMMAFFTGLAHVFDLGAPDGGAFFGFLVGAFVGGKGRTVEAENENGEEEKKNRSGYNAHWLHLELDS